MQVHAKISQIALNNLDLNYENVSDSNYNRKVLQYVSQFSALMNADCF